MTYPWEQLPATAEPAPLPAATTVEDTVAALQRDFAYAVRYTAVLVHSEHEELALLVNTPRGRFVPQGKCRFSDGTAFELQDIAMPQVGAPEMTIEELLTKIWQLAHEKGLEVAP